MPTMECVLTGKEVVYEDLNSHRYYVLSVAGNEVEVFVCRDCRKRIVRKTAGYIIEGLIANKKWPKRTEVVSESCSLSERIKDGETIVLEEYLRTAEYPKTPREKLDYLLLNLYKHQSFDGEKFSLNLTADNFVLKNFFVNDDECIFYLSGLAEEELIHFQRRTSSGVLSYIKFTHLGLSKTIELTEEGEKSNKCFIAMSFAPSTRDTREAIRKALSETGYEAIIIDEQNVDSDKTINDEIIASLKRCKFCIADFSFHSNGVYFESGFALGQGKKVIYTCSKEEFDKAHFDIRPLQHIIYESTEQLKRDLVHKIEAFIN